MLSLRTVLILFLSLGVFNIFSARGQVTLPKEEYDELMNIKTRYLLLQQDSIKLVEQIKANKALQETLDIAKSQLQNLVKLETANQEQKTSLEKLTKENAELKKENESFDGFKKERKDLTSRIKELEKKEALLDKTLVAKSQVEKDLANKTTQLNKLELLKSEYEKNDSLLIEIQRFKREGDLMARENIAKDLSELKKATTAAKADAVLQNISKNLAISKQLNPDGYDFYISGLVIHPQLFKGVEPIIQEAQSILNSPYSHNRIEVVLPILESSELLMPNFTSLNNYTGLISKYCQIHVETYNLMVSFKYHKSEEDKKKAFEAGTKSVANYPYLKQKLFEVKDETGGPGSLFNNKITIDKPEKNCEK